MKGRVVKHSYILFALIIVGLFSAALMTQRSVRPARAQEGTKITPDIPVIPPGSAYRQTNLVSDIPGVSPLQDPLLVNPWGVTATSSSPFWVATPTFRRPVRPLRSSRPVILGMSIPDSPSLITAAPIFFTQPISRMEQSTSITVLLRFSPPPVFLLLIRPFRQRRGTLITLS